MDRMIYEPLKQYPELSEKVAQKAGNIFDNAVKEAAIDVSQNKELSAEIAKSQADLQRERSEYQSARRKRGWMIFLIVFLAIFAAVLLFVGLGMISGGNAYGAIVAVCFLLPLAGMIAAIVYLKKKINPIVRKEGQDVEVANQKLNKLLAQAKRLLSPLYERLDWGLPQKAISEATGIIQLDQSLDQRKYAYLCEKYGYQPSEGPNDSTVAVLSGSIVGNPFLLVRDFHHRYGPKVYTGTRTIVWTTTSYDSEGNPHVQTHSETLVAHATHDAPFYSYSTYFVYGSPSAPNLRFSRSPTVRMGASEEEVDRYVKKTIKGKKKEITKKLTDGDPSNDITLLTNDKFEALWNAFDRDNEVEYRFLFTPLAQQNLVAWLMNQNLYGDDFTFKKEHKLNYIISRHDQNAEIIGDPRYLESLGEYDLEKLRQDFVAWCQDAFKTVYGDLGPILSIPAYQQDKPEEMIYGHPFETNVARYEHESIANSFVREVFAPKNTSTEVLLKGDFLQEDGEFDRVHIKAMAYHTTPMVDHVAVMGGDGKLHDVPVPWIQYDRKTRDSVMEVAPAKSTRYDFGNLEKNQGFQNFLSSVSSRGYLYQRQLFAYVCGEKSDPNNNQGAAPFLHPSPKKE